MNKRRVLKRLAYPKARKRILDQFNRENLDDVGPVGGDQSMAVLQDANELEVRQDEFVKRLASRADVL